MFGLLKRAPAAVPAPEEPEAELPISAATAARWLGIAEYHAFQARMRLAAGEHVNARHELTDAAEHLRQLGGPARFETPQDVDDWIALKRSGEL